VSNWGPALQVGLATIAMLAAWGCATPSTQEPQEPVRDEARARARFGEGPPSRVLLLTVAGLVPSNYLDPFGHAAGEGALVHMPELARLAREGVTGLAAFAPSPGATRATHATLVTGAGPARHGIVADVTLEEEGAWIAPRVDSRLLRGVTLWDAALGRGVVALDWPMTAGARIEMLLPEPGGDGSGSWLERVRAGTSPVVMRILDEIAEEAGRDASSEAAALGGFAWPDARERDAAKVEVACRLLGSEREAGLWLVRLDQTRPVLQASGIGTVDLDEALARIDAEIGRLVGCFQAAGRLSDTAIFVTGDVAFQPVHTRVAPNVALVKSGLIGRDPRASGGVRSWLALVLSNGRSAYVYARDEANAVEAREVLRVEAVRTGAFRVVSATELAEVGGDPQAWFGLVAEPGYVLGDSLTGPVLRPASRRAAAGGLRGPQAQEDDSAVGFVAWGRGIRNSVRVPTLELTSVAPTIAALLGLRLDEDLEEAPLIGILRSATAPPPPGPKRLDGSRRTLEERARARRELRAVGGRSGADRLEP